MHEEKKSIKNPDSNKSLSKIDEFGSWQNGVFTCSICGKEFLEKLKLVRHVESAHERNKPDLAEHVESVPDIEAFGEKFDKRKLIDDYLEDKEALNKQGKKLIKNPVSNKSFSKIDEIGSWQNDVFTCSICGKKFLEKLKLVIHVELAHEKKKSDLVKYVPDIKDFGEKSDKSKLLDDHFENKEALNKCPEKLCNPSLLKREGNCFFNNLVK